MYVIKVGEYYVKGYVGSSGRMDKSKELMRGYDKETAEKIAKATNGEVIEMTEEVTND